MENVSSSSESEELRIRLRAATDEKVIVEQIHFCEIELLWDDKNYLRALATFL